MRTILKYFKNIFKKKHKIENANKEIYIIMLNNNIAAKDDISYTVSDTDKLEFHVNLN